MVFNDIVLFLHFFGLMVAAAGGMAAGIIMRRAASMPPEDAKAVRGLGPLLNNTALVGIAILWITGLIMGSNYGFGNLPGMFWVKFAFVVILTALAIFSFMTYREIRGGNVAAASRLPILGPLTGLSALLAVLFAVLTFH